MRAYRTLTPLDGDGFGTAVPAPLGRYAAGDLVDADADAASYVPSGTAPVDAVLLAESGRQVPVEPNLSGVDALTSPPGAFTDLAGGTALRGSAPVDAIRVRVAGVADYAPAARDRVAEVAAEIEALGLGVTVVAGSSPQPVDVLVADHGGADGTRDLGWVRQPWTTLGAAVTVEGAMTDATVALGIGACAAVALGLVVTGLLAGRARQGEVAALHRVGWRRRRITRRLLAREVTGVAAIVVVAGVAATVPGSDVPWTLLPVPLLGVGAAAASVAVALAPLRARPTVEEVRRRPAPRSSVAPISARTLGATPAALARRHVLAARLPSGIAVLATVLIAVLAASSATAVTDALGAAGQTRLADLGRSVALGLVVVSAAVGATATVVVLGLGRGIERVERRRRAAILDRLGLRPGVVARVQRREDALLAAAGLLGALVVAGGALAAASPLAASAALGAGVLAQAPRLVSVLVPARPPSPPRRGR